MKKILYIFILFTVSCSRITPEEKQRLTSDIHSLYQQTTTLQKKVDILESEKDTLEEDIKFLESKKIIYELGKIPVYVLTLHFQEHKMEISFDRISFSFDVPVDEQFYKECKIGEEIGRGSRSFKLFHSGDITVQDKKIIYR
jgi:hypothetical protein